MKINGDIFFFIMLLVLYHGSFTVDQQTTYWQGHNFRASHGERSARVGLREVVAAHEVLGGLNKTSSSLQVSQTHRPMAA